MKRLIVFDLDGTLTESKSEIDVETAILLDDLLSVVKAAIISGGDLPQFEKQLLARLAQSDRLDNLSILPTCGTKFFQHKTNWQKLYSEDLTKAQKQEITDALNAAVASAGFRAEKTWGDPIEDRESQITYSALGQQAPLDEKKGGIPILPSERRSKRFSTHHYRISPFGLEERLP